jgi:hypothetical protein
MTPRLVIAVLIAGSSVLTQDLSACGDKFLVLGRGTRFQRPGKVRPPANILVYADPASGLPNALANLPVDETLRKAGYRPTSVSTAHDLDQALQRGGWDLVLADAAESDAIAKRVAGDNRAPVVLPVLYNASGAELERLKKQYRCVLKSPAKNQSFLDVIDDALASRPKAPKVDAKAGR